MKNKTTALAGLLAVLISAQAAYSQELSQAWKNWQGIKSSAHFQKTASPAALQGADASSFIPRLDAFLSDLEKRHTGILKELKDGKAQCFKSSPEVSSEKGLECLNLQNQFLQDYEKYVTRLRALKLFTAAILGTGGAQEPGIYPSLDLTQALQLRDRLAASLFLSSLPPTKTLPRQFYLAHGAGSEGLETADSDRIAALADEEKKDVNAIFARYLTVVCGEDFTPSHETLASFHKAADSINGLSSKICGLFR